jgi:hypothetical protein
LVPALQAGQLSLDDENTPGLPLSDLGKAVSQFLKDEPFLSAPVLAKRLATRSRTIMKVLVRDLLMTQGYLGQLENWNLNANCRDTRGRYHVRDFSGARGVLIPAN